MDYFYDGLMYFGASKNKVPLQHLEEPGFFANSDCVWLKEESHIHLGWLEVEYIMRSFSFVGEQTLSVCFTVLFTPLKSK